jgi:predicted Ser/Thr protein kinase
VTINYANTCISPMQTNPLSLFDVQFVNLHLQMRQWRLT